MKSIVRLNTAISNLQNGKHVDEAIFLKLLKSKNSQIRLETACFLGQLGASWVVNPLGELIFDIETEVRNEAIFALAETCRPLAAKCLIEALKDTDLERREDARTALAILLGSNIADSFNVILSGEEEANQVGSWWQANIQKFDFSLCYAWGKVVNLEDWIIRLQNSPTEVAKWLLERLFLWTGMKFGDNPSTDVAKKWLMWWENNRKKYQEGKRYYFSQFIE